jgi:uncharacterized membrane protein YoaK (UPF0700 family)
MQKLAPIPPAVPPLLAFVAGYVDACTFLGLFGLFVAQVTGSFVVAGAQFVVNDTGIVVKVLAIPVFFLSGVLTTVVARVAARRGRSALSCTLALECALLVGFILVILLAGPMVDPHAFPAMLAALLGLSAMGSQSALVRVLALGAYSTNVMTTNTTQIAIDTAEFFLARRALRRDPAQTEASAELAAARSRLAALLPLAFGFLLGTFVGAVVFTETGVACLWAAAAIIFGLAVWGRKLDRGALPLP